jgi:hypothetical protein
MDREAIAGILCWLGLMLLWFGAIAAFGAAIAGMLEVWPG